MNASEIPNTELGLCCKMLHYCAWASPHTEHMTPHELLEILGQLFPVETLDQARRILSGEEEYPDE